MDYIGQRFGNRIIVGNNCTAENWTSLGLRIPARPDKYKLTKCLNCGSVLPCSLKNLVAQPPKRCVLCSNIGNHSNVETLTNTWAIYDDCAVCNVVFHKQIVSFYVDSKDYDMVSEYTWRISQKRQKYYAVTGSAKKHTQLYLHALIFGNIPDGFEIDHIDGNSLNNQRNNLRAVSRQENIDNQRATRIDNQIGIRGVVCDKRSGKYQVDFYYHGRRYYTKPWETIEEAVWCRYCFEDHFGIPALKNNPLAKQYFTLDAITRDAVLQYVQEKILRNERYKSLHARQQLSEDPQAGV